MLLTWRSFIRILSKRIICHPVFSVTSKMDKKKYTTQLSAPKKEKKDAKMMSETVRKLKEEKERERKEQERKRIEEEKKARFRIPKVGDKRSNSEENNHSSHKKIKTDSSSSHSEKSSSSASGSSNSSSHKHKSSHSSKSSSHSSSDKVKSSSSHSSSDKAKSSSSHSSSDKAKSSSSHSSSDKAKSSSSHSSSDKAKSSSSHSSIDKSKSSSHSSSDKSKNSSSKSSSENHKNSSSSSSHKPKSSSSDSVSHKSKTESSMLKKLKDISLDLGIDISDGEFGDDYVERPHSENRKEIIISDSGNTKIVAANTPSNNSNNSFSETEKNRIRKEFEAKVARMKANLQRDKDERINFADGKIGHKRDSSDTKKPQKESEPSKREKDKKQSSNDKIDTDRHRGSVKKKRRRRPKLLDDSIMEVSFKHDKSKMFSTENSKKPVDHKKPKPKPKLADLNKNKQAPAMNFADILKMAQEKAKEPVPFVTKPKPKIKEPEKGRPLTQEEKDKEARLQEYKERIKNRDSKESAKPSNSGKANGSILKHELLKENLKEKTNRDSPVQKYNGKHEKESDRKHLASSKHSSKSVSSNSLNSGKVNKSFNTPKTPSSNSSKIQNSAGSKTPSSAGSRTPSLAGSKTPSSTGSKTPSSTSSKTPSSVDRKYMNHSSNGGQNTSAIKGRQISSHISKGGQSSSKPGLQIKKTLSAPTLNGKSNPGNKMTKPSPSVKKPVDSNRYTSGLKRPQPSSSSGKPNIKEGSAPKKMRPNDSKYDVTNENILVCGPSKQKAKPPPSNNPWDRIYGQIQERNPKPVKKKQVVLDSDSEEEDDLDGFIADSDEEVVDTSVEDYSSYIRDIFGYDKRKYKYESDYEIANMETNFREQMKEEAKSARLGLQEDLEDIRREEEELKRKAAAKKRKR